MLQAKNISKEYSSTQKIGLFRSERFKKLAVEDISLSVKTGQIIGILGKNGAGKTTTIKMLTSMIAPSKGEILLDGVSISNDSNKFKRKINLISGGERSIYWRLTGQENLEYFGRLYGIPEQELKTRIQNILQLVDLEKEKDVPVEKYSKGMKQRLQIARGLVNDPDFIFLDEPTLGLDIVIAKELRSYVKKLAMLGKGVVLTTHYIQEAEELCDYIYIINDGKLVVEGTPEDIKKQYNKQKIWRFSVNTLSDDLCQALESYSNEDTVECEKGSHTFIVKTHTDDITGYFRIISMHNTEIVNVSAVEQTLEDALFKIIKG